MGLSTIAQNACSTYFPFKEGTKFQMTNFNGKGKKEGIVDHEITTIKNDVATMSTKVSDEKGKEVISSDYEVTCNGNGISIDFKSMMNAELFKQYKDMNMEMSGTNIEFPNNLKVGQSLKDAKFEMAIDMSGIKMKMTVDMVNRTVDTKESITTSAGTFDCFLISYDSEISMGIKRTFKNKEWIAEGIGMVKSENYNSKGKLMSYSELTKFN